MTARTETGSEVVDNGDGAVNQPGGDAGEDRMGRAGVVRPRGLPQAEAPAGGRAETDHEIQWRLLDKAEVAQRLGVTERHISRLVGERRIPFIRVGTKFIRFDPRDIDAWLEDARVPVTPPWKPGGRSNAGGRR